MNSIQFNPKSISNDLIDLIPGYGLIGSDLDSFADCMYIPEKPDKAFGEIRIVSQRPQRSAVPVNDDRLALQHTLNDGIASVIPVYAERNGTLVIGMAGADDGDGKAVFPVQLHQIILSGDLVSGIFPIGIGKRSPFVDPIIGKWLLIGRSGADIEKLSGLALKEPVIPFQLGGNKGDKVCYGIKAKILDQCCDCSLIIDICF